MTDNYNDIIHLPRPDSPRPRMSIGDRAAQFSPFAALKGYDDEIDEAARTTQQRIERDDQFAEELNEKLLSLCQHAAAHPLVSVTYFRPDDKKSGGAYLTTLQPLRKVDTDRRTLVFADGLAVPFDDILDLALQ